MSASSPAKKQKMQTKRYHMVKYNRNKRYLEPGQRGFLVTCNFREKDCIREAYNILNEYADQLYGKEDASEKADTEAEVQDENNKLEDKDIADDLEGEIAAATKRNGGGTGRSKTRFQMVDTGAQNCIFISTTLPNPSELGTHIVKDIANTRAKKTRFLLRLVPIEAVCRANSTDITAAAGLLFDKYFLKESYTYSVMFNKRYNNDIKRDDIIHELAELVQSKNIKNRVDLKQPERTVVVEIIKGLCCISVVEGYLKYKRYNLAELANAKADENQSKDDDAQKEAATTEDQVTTEEPEDKLKDTTKIVEEAVEQNKEADNN